MDWACAAVAQAPNAASATTRATPRDPRLLVPIPRRRLGGLSPRWVPRAATLALWFRLGPVSMVSPFLSPRVSRGPRPPRQAGLYIKLGHAASSARFFIASHGGRGIRAPSAQGARDHEALDLVRALVDQ